jgi:hypothetical protein
VRKTEGLLNWNPVTVIVLLDWVAEVVGMLYLACKQAGFWKIVQSVGSGA